ncbi:cytokinin dehydrogenase 6-like [Phoenix dactylifera]|uniref:cytokinin dehydrogenase n=1 Tax=Phoenix dactylifera TaxID=42345 RepID=A0A8B8J7P9_PHODC|nr:cytokinin dehydrogenase 6-like [Phoenix dactylifera]
MVLLTTSSISTFLIVLFITSSLVPTVGPSHRPWPEELPEELQALGIGPRTRIDHHATTRASTDFGRLTQALPAAVLYPSSVHDIMTLVRFSYSSPKPFTIAPRGHGHSVRGQALAPHGVVIEMTSMRRGGGGDGDGEPRIRVSPAGSVSGYVDAGGEQFWIDVLRETLKYGLAPMSWTDYLYLTVGGTLSNAGVSGQAFLHGPQISNVYELDVITGKGEMVTCSEDHEPDLFFAVLGGLGQFGIITRARIALEPAPQMVRWVRLIYTNFEAFARDQEKLISLDDGNKGFNYVEGSILMDHHVGNNWRSSFFSERDLERISSLAAQYGAVYCLEGARYYDKAMVHMVDQELEWLLEGLSFMPGFAFTNDVTYIRFLNRVRDGELKLRSQGLWNVPHPWLNIFVPRSRIIDFDRGVFKSILRHDNSTGPILIYPMDRNKWDRRMSAVIPDEEIFYSIGLLRSGVHAWERLENQNKEILHFCNQAGISHKQYLPHYTTQADWMEHFGSKWETIVERKRRYDPKSLLSPGQQIFTSSMAAHNSSSKF